MENTLTNFLQSFVTVPITPVSLVVPPLQYEDIKVQSSTTSQNTSVENSSHDYSYIDEYDDSQETALQSELYDSFDALTVGNNSVSTKSQSSASIAHDINKNIKQNIVDTQMAEVKKSIKQISESVDIAHRTVQEINILFDMSGTLGVYKTQWLSLYRKAVGSNDDSEKMQKMRDGKFRITEKGDIIILPQYPMHDKNVKECLKDKWLPTVTNME